MSKRFRITLADEWAKWADGEAMHRGQSLSKLLEDALSAFERELICTSDDRTAECFRGWERRRRMKARIRAKLTPAQKELLHL